jgi:NAD(P)-dependent dehydrogenase (short-subunit alcohol dehydrogenase family)
MKTIPSLAGKVAVVTGASRGVGARIATLLGEQGATVYVTGRTTVSKPGTTPGTITEVADSPLQGQAELALPFYAIMQTTHRSSPLPESESRARSF